MHISDIQFLCEILLRHLQPVALLFDPLAKFHLVKIHIFILSACCGRAEDTQPGSGPLFDA
jgi:hypothetical protein